MIKNLIVLIIISGILCSCANNESTVYLKSNNLYGLSKKDMVHINGFEIGKVDDIVLNMDGGIIITLKINKETKIPTDSKFRVMSMDMFGTKGIAIELGERRTCISDNDTLNFTDETWLPPDSLKTEIKGFIENLNSTNQKDSILIELRRLNKNLEELNHSD